MIGWRSKPLAGDVDNSEQLARPEGPLGDLMRGQRATMGKSLLDVQRDLKIKATYIAAIENGDLSVFDAPGFIAGYVRSYARYLGMEPEAAFRHFCADTHFVAPQGVATTTSVARPAGARKKEPQLFIETGLVPFKERLLSHVEPRAVGSLLVLIGLIVAIGYGGWSVFQEVQRVQLAPVDQAPGVLSDSDPLAGEGAVIAAASGPNPAEVPVTPNIDALDRLYRPRALDVPVFISRDGPIALIGPDSVGVLAETGGAGGSPYGRC